jgi:hypothetical protein
MKTESTYIGEMRVVTHPIQGMFSCSHEYFLKHLADKGWTAMPSSSIGQITRKPKKK